MCFIQKKKKKKGNIILYTDAMAKQAKHFNENLHASRENKTVKLDVGNLINTQSLPQGQSNSSEGFISRQEVLSALQCMKNDICPGSEGYTAEFFKFLFCRCRQLYSLFYQLWI